MIPRYTLPEMGALWSEETKFQKWLDVEIAVCEVHAEMGTVPREALERIKNKAKFSVARIHEIEKTTDHDVIAFTTNLAESIGEAARFVHYGLTSSDVVDTANALLLRDACDILLQKIDGLLPVLKRRAHEFENTPQVGRTHGIHAEPTSFGLTFALWYDEMRRNRERLIKAQAAVAVGKISGAVGAFAHLDPQVEESVCEKLGLKPAPVSTQIVHSSAERVVLPDSSIVTDYMLDKMASLIDGLIVYPERMLENLQATRGLIFSGQLLLALTDAGVGRETAYDWVQRNAMKAWDEGGDFKSLVLADQEIRAHLTVEQIAHVFSVDTYLRNVDKI